jgi:hypothetical protein
VSRGSDRNLVFCRESSDREIKIGVGFPFNVAARSDFTELIVDHALDSKFDSLDIVLPTERCDILFTVGKLEHDGRPTARRLEIAFDGIPFVSLKADSEEDNAYVESVNLFHHLLGAIPGASQLLCLVTKLTAVGYLKKPTFCKHAKNVGFFFIFLQSSVSLSLSLSSPRFGE